MSKKDVFVLGDWNAICDRCGFKYKASELRLEWNNLRTCEECWEPRQPQDLLKGRPDDPSVDWARPEGEEYELGTNEVTPDDL